MKSTEQEREEIKRTLFPGGIPKLWCPMIVQYGADGKIDGARMEGHLKSMVGYVKSFLIFGSTGDGWELNGAEKQEMIQLYAQWAKRYGIRMLLGVLQPEMGASLREMKEWMAWMKEETGETEPTAAMQALGVCGFTVCAPKGAQLTQEVIERELAQILDEGVPVAIYQLPQITENEIAAETVEKLAGKYANFYLFKDTSGEDRVLKAGLGYGGVFFVRGAEGTYADWYGAEGKYDGFLLSSANCLGKQLSMVLEAWDKQDERKAKEASEKVDRVISATFAHTSDLAGGNVFANANKCIDHCLAYGAEWREHPAPMRHCGERIPEAYIAFAEQALASEGLMPEKGYMCR